MNSQPLHVVIGATGGVGSAVVRALVAHGEHVRAVNRSELGALPAGVEAVRADALDLAQMRAACQGAAVIYNCVNPPFAQWDTLFPRVMETLIAAAAASGAILVFADDTWMYGPPSGPLNEEHPQRPAGALGQLRGRLSEMLLEAHRSGAIRGVIGRASELYGPGVESLLGANLFRAAVTGKRLIWPGSLDMALNPTFVDDFARALVTLGTHDAALGQVWHIAPAEPTTGRAFTAELVAQAGTHAPVSALPRSAVRALGLVWPLARIGHELIYQFDAPYIIRGDKYRRVFGGTPTPYREGIRQTLAWYAQAAAAQQPRQHWWREMWRYGRADTAPRERGAR